MAEALLKREGGEDFEVCSAGTKLSGKEELLQNLLPATKEVLEVMEEIGLPIGDSLRKNVTTSMIQNADRIVVIYDENDPIPEEVSNSGKVTFWKVSDPKGQSYEFTKSVREELEKKIKDLVKEYSHTL